VHGVIESRERLLDRHLVVRHVQLPQIDVINAQPSQRQVQLTEHCAARRIDHGLLAPPAQAALGRNDELLARDDVAEQAAEDLLRPPGGVRGAGIYQRAAGFVERDQLVSGVVFVRLATPSPGAEPEMGDEQSAASYPALFHGTNLAAPHRGIWLRL